MTITISEWRKAILEYFVAEANGVYRATTKAQLFRQFGTNADEDTEMAFLSLIRDELILSVNAITATFYTINFDKKHEIKAIIFGPEEKKELGINQPHISEWEGLKREFETESNRALPNHGKYYHCTRETQADFWVTLVKTKRLGKADRIILGSLSDPESRIFRIWTAIDRAARESKDATFIKQRIEELEPKACGNTRQTAKAAFEVLEFLGLIQMVTSKGRSGIYIKTGAKIPLITLDDIFKELIEKEKTQSGSASVIVKETK